ncbi:EAL domain-containing protein [Ideonella sp. DXS29W]|uniref:EAL domain-containing protein n=1 Tax=Ideonella lacteola TaxID=2984193 RepID=A0ABU9BVZ7_9BURK
MKPHDLMPHPGRRITQIAGGLTEALERGELSLAYQPQVCLATGEVVGAEALMRWHSAELGEVPPSEFVPVAEACGLIGPLGLWALRTACAQAAAWRAARLPALRVSVNVAPHQFSGADMVAEVRQALAAHGLPAQALGIEITEGALMQDAHRVADALRQLQSDGVEISLDDFGTGYSSLSRLRDLPIDLVKIDRSFVADVGAAASSASVTRSVIRLAKELHMQVLAEGVETEEQLKQLVKHGCDRIQGWVFGKAMSSDDFAELLASRRRLPEEMTHRHSHQRTLLLVDDEENILSALRRLVRRDGYRVLTASSGQEGLTLLRAHHVDVIISDQRMPGMTGVEFLRQAKLEYPDTIRMTLSGYTDLQSIIDAVNEGAVYKFLTKPWDDALLREHIAQAFRQRELAEENRRLAHEVSSANSELAAANRRLEHSVRREHDLLRTMQTAAGNARDMVDLVPIAIFGFDPDGLLVYANQRARKVFPAWCAGIGDSPDPALRGVLTQTPPDAQQGCRVRLGGSDFEAWVGRLALGTAESGSLLMLRVVGVADSA